MDPVPRSRRLLLRLTLTLLAACAASPSLEPVGTSRGGPAAARAHAAGAPSTQPAASPLPPEFRTAWTKQNHARFVSQGHAGGRYDADVFASEPVNGRVALGARFIEEMFEHGTNRPGPTYMMERLDQAADAADASASWRYVVVGPRGELVKDGPIESCAGCHREAPRDQVFTFEP